MQAARNNVPYTEYLHPILSDIQKSPSPGIELRSLFSGVLALLCSLPVSRNKCAKFGANRCILSRAISERADQRTIERIHNFIFICKINNIVNNSGVEIVKEGRFLNSLK
jgi:hypothetical protein